MSAVENAPDRLITPCTGQDMTRWAPPEGQAPDPTAALLCRRCPIREACYAQGTAEGATGIYGSVWLVNGKPVTQPAPGVRQCACGRPVSGKYARYCADCRADRYRSDPPATPRRAKLACSRPPAPRPAPPRTCLDCPSPAEAAYLRCGPCRAEHRRATYRKSKAGGRARARTCRHCGAPVDPRRRCCDTCNRARRARQAGASRAAQLLDAEVGAFSAEHRGASRTRWLEAG